MLTSFQIRQSFLDFFREKQHTIVPSASLLPDSPNLLFTNAGMNQFVPIFLGEKNADVSKWGGAIAGGDGKPPGLDTRAADTQKCIRAGGKHNDLDDVGLDTYHHTFFEMLGNWSFGDYFKKEAIEWSWELIVERFQFPPNRVYATVYCPHMDVGVWEQELKYISRVCDGGGELESSTYGQVFQSSIVSGRKPFGGLVKWEPSDMEAAQYWFRKFQQAGLDPLVHIVPGNKKDNFWMMGETGPCGPCSEIHIDLTPEPRTPDLESRGTGLVNQGTAECIEIWNNVFIQFNANPDGTLTPLPAKHVDTGMGFERLVSIIQCTKNFTDFANAKISNYETDIFRPIFEELERMTAAHGTPKTYRSTLPGAQNGPNPAHLATFPQKTDAPISSGGGVPAGGGRVPVAGGGVPASGGAPISASDAPAARNSAPASAGGTPAASGDAPISQSSAPLSAGASPVSAGGTPADAPAALGASGKAPESDQIAIDVAFRVIADHIRTLSFAIADGIQPGNNDRNYVLRRILRRAVRYGRTLGFREPFFYKLTAVLARTMGDVFPEIRAKQKLVEETLKREEEAFNKTLDKGIALFEAEAARLCGAATLQTTATADSTLAKARSAPGSAGFQPAPSGFQPDGGVGILPTEAGAKYWKRRLPHYERPHAIYHITFSTRARRKLSPAARDIALKALIHFDRARYDLYAACVMPDHVHVIFQPWIKERTATDEAVFWSISELMHSVKSFTSTQINKAENSVGKQVWENEYHDRILRGDNDVEEKFVYVCSNPWTDGVVGPEEPYPWLWTWNERGVLGQDAQAVRLEAGQSGLEARAPQSASASARATTNNAGSAESAGSAGSAGFQPASSGFQPDVVGILPTGFRSAQISGAFAFRLYDEQGFPLDLTQLMARERGLTVDVEGPEGFDFFMAQQKARARAAQKKQVIELSEIETKEPTNFIGYDSLTTPAKVLEVVSLKDRTAVILDTTTAYAEMGGQVGDTGELSRGADSWRILNTQKSGATWLHFVEGVDTPDVGAEVTFGVEVRRRRAIERHHTVTHLLHWALHEVVSRETTQKGSFVGPDKLTFDFNSAALTPAQVRDIEWLVNERIVENSRVAWIEVPYADVRGRADVMQFFGDKYGETVRVVQIGGATRALDGYSMELCAGTHTRATGEIGLFRINAEAAIAAGVRRIEAVAGLTAYDLATADMQRLHALAVNLGTPLPELEKRIEGMLAQHKELERALKSAQQREAAGRAKDLIANAETINGIPAIIANLGALDADAAVALAEALKGSFPGVVVLGTAGGGSVALIASVGKEHQAKVQAGKIIQAIAPIVGGKGGGKPDFARGGGKDAGKLDEALAKAKTLL